MAKLNTTTSGIITSVLTADSSPTLELQENGVTFRTLGQSQLVSGTAVTASGAFVEFPGIPSWAKRITVMFNGISTSGSSQLRFQIGSSGGVETSGYLGTCSQIGVGAATALMPTGGFEIYSGAAGNIVSGTAVFSLLSGSTWVFTFLGASTAGSTLTFTSGGTKTITGILDRVRITTANGTDTFDAGTINIMWE